jgi:hypothetical protein
MVDRGRGIGRPSRSAQANRGTGQASPKIEIGGRHIHTQRSKAKEGDQGEDRQRSANTGGPP